MARRSRFLEDLIGGVGLGANLADMYLEHQSGEAYTNAAKNAAGDSVPYVDATGDGVGAGSTVQTPATLAQQRAAGLQAQGDYWAGRGDIKRASALYDQVDQMGLRGLQREDARLGIETKRQAAKVRDEAAAVMKEAKEVQAALAKGDYSKLQAFSEKHYNGNLPGLDDGKAIRFLDDGMVAHFDPKTGYGVTRQMTPELAAQMLDYGVSQRLAALSPEAWQKEREFGLKQSKDAREDARWDRHFANEDKKREEEVRFHNLQAKKWDAQIAAMGGKGSGLSSGQWGSIPVIDTDTGSVSNAKVEKVFNKKTGETEFRVNGNPVSEADLNAGRIVTGVGQDSPVFGALPQLKTMLDAAAKTGDTEKYKAAKSEYDTAMKLHQAFVQNRKADPESAVSELLPAVKKGLTAQEVLQSGYSPAVLDYFETDAKGRLRVPKTSDGAGIKTGATASGGAFPGIRLRDTGLIPDAVKYWGDAGQSTQVNYLQGKLDRGETLQPNEMVRAKRLGLMQ